MREKLLTLTMMALPAMAAGVDSTVVKHDLDAGWQFRQARLQNWHPATVPGTVHTDLMACGLLDDPFLGLNERGAQWVDKEDWEYQTTFCVADDVLSRSHVLLEFDGIDTYADVFLNDSLVLQADNMFRRWSTDVRTLLTPGENRLRVMLHSPVKVDLPKWEALPFHYEAGNDQSENGGLLDRKLSVFARKAGYHYGWDWGPRLVTLGIWRPVRLTAWDGLRIADVHTRQPQVTKALARVRQDIEIEADADGEVTVTTTDADTGRRYASRKVAVRKGLNRVVLEFTIRNPRLWWTNGLGEPALYSLSTTVSDGRRADSRQQRIGLRSLRLLTAEDSDGQEFCFELNGQRVFMKGANYIPCDNFLPRVTDSVYRRTIDDAASVGMNMLRVWGGGTYEDDRFYDLCDERGILVWQDFMFACSLYPAEGHFLENVRHEAEDNVRRLRNHPCLALLCGNNECQDGWYNWGWKRRYEAQDTAIATRIARQQAALYYETLPDVVARLAPETPYWPSSPFGGYGHGSRTNWGDYHYWDVWHGRKPIAEYNETHFRFCSEYGMQSFPELATVQRFAPDSSQWDIYSDVMMAHQRGGAHANGLIETYLLSEYRRPADFPSLLYVGQLMQGDAMKTAIAAHRRDKGYCWGTLLWQINDCWPVASWATRDYYGRWKAAHYMMRQAFADVLVSPVERDGRLQVFVVNDRMQGVSGTLALQVVDMDGRQLGSVQRHVKAGANVSVPLLSLDTDSLLAGADRSSVALVATLTDNGGQTWRDVHFLLPPRSLALKPAHIECSVRPVQGGYELTLSADHVARGVCIALGQEPATFSDNYFDLLPGERKTVAVATRLAEAEFNRLLKINAYN